MQPPLSTSSPEPKIPANVLAAEGLVLGNMVTGEVPQYGAVDSNQGSQHYEQVKDSMAQDSFMATQEQVEMRSDM